MSGAVGLTDPRLVAARSDLARAGLEGRVAAERFVEPHSAVVSAGTAAVRRAPARNAALDTEALWGETAAVLEDRDGWSWVQLDRDGYVGYVESSALSPATQRPTHRIKALATFVYPEPSIKTPPVAELPLGARVTIVEVGETLSRLAGGGHVATRHTTEPDRFERDFVDVAERFVGTPYLWGGRTRRGIDCSGLVQTAMHAAGFVDTPRDSHVQEAAIGLAVLVPERLDGLMRGDLVFWAGHVGIMLDDLMLLHANAHHMAVVVEPLATAVARIRRAGHEISGIRRPPALTAAGQASGAGEGVT
ncbi:MAG: NlpC/P60 family protein [Hyphomicrobiaceae bacterium]